MALPEPIPRDIASAANELIGHLELPKATTAKPVLILLTGLPGTGKSFLGRKLVERLPSVIVETDFVRKTLFPSPTYSPSESRFVYEVCYWVIDQLLRRGWRVIFDATNLYERGREQARHLAEQAGAKALIVRTVAAEDAARERLERRAHREDPADLSDADLSIHERFQSREQRIHLPHITIETTQPIEEAVAKILRTLRRL